MTGTISVRVVTVKSTAPLKVAESTGRQWLTAHVVAGSSYSPVVGDSVVAVWDGTQYQLIGHRTGSTAPDCYLDAYQSGTFATIANNSHGTVNFGTIFVPRPCRLRVGFYCQANPGTGFQQAAITVQCDRAGMDTGGYSTCLVPTNAHGHISQLVAVGTKAVTPGTHLLGVQCTAGGGGATVKFTNGYLEAFPVF